jgi:hypothetical protein
LMNRVAREHCLKASNGLNEQLETVCGWWWAYWSIAAARWWWCCCCYSYALMMVLCQDPIAID